MATLIRRSEVLRRINQLEEKAGASGDKKGAEWLVKAFNAVMSCKVEERVFCAQCGKTGEDGKDPGERTGGDIILPGQMSVEDFL